MVLGKKQSFFHCSFHMNMILYKSTHCPFLPHYPLSNHAVVTRTMKISRIYLLLFDTRNLVIFLCSGWLVVVLYVTPTRALMLVKKLQSWRVVAPFQGRWEELLKNRWHRHFWIWTLQPLWWVPNHFSLNSWGCGVFTYSRSSRLKGRCAAYQS